MERGLSIFVCGSAALRRGSETMQDDLAGDALCHHGGGDSFRKQQPVRPSGCPRNGKDGSGRSVKMPCDAPSFTSTSKVQLRRPEFWAHLQAGGGHAVGVEAPMVRSRTPLDRDLDGLRGSWVCWRPRARRCSCSSPESLKVDPVDLTWVSAVWAGRCRRTVQNLRNWPHR